MSKALETYCRRNKGYAHRFPDTKAAGNFLPAQPGDHQLLIPGVAILIEDKSTEVGDSLMTLLKHDAKTRAQVLKHYLWNRAGHPSYYVWADIVAGPTAVYRGMDVVTAYRGRAAAPEPIFTGATSPEQMARLVEFLVKEG
jgi:hypothetical protein